MGEGRRGGWSGSSVARSVRWLLRRHGPALRARFCAEPGLADPGISWLTARDRVAEFGTMLAMVCGTLARIGIEVYELARPEIGELSEPAPAGAVSSITMPHKRNPEGSEHLDTLARLARSAAAVLVEGMVAGHERDGRVVEGGVDRAARGLPAHRGGAAAGGGGWSTGWRCTRRRWRPTCTGSARRSGSERVLAGLTARIGKHRAQQVLHEILRGGESDVDLPARWPPAAWPPRTRSHLGHRARGGRGGRHGRRRPRPPRPGPPGPRTPCPGPAACSRPINAVRAASTRRSSPHCTRCAPVAPITNGTFART